VVERSVLRRDYPIMVVAMAIATVFAMTSQQINRYEALFLLSLLGGFLWLCLREAVSQSRQYRATGQFQIGQAAPKRIAKNAARAVAGLIGLVIGAQLMVDNAVAIARMFDISELVIGVTIVAFGTSLPELATSLVAAFRKEPDMSLGNIIGSNIFNTTFILGGVSLVAPIQASSQAVRFDLPAAMLIGLLLFPLMRMGNRISRVDAAVLLGAYVSYVVLSVLYSTGVWGAA
jgi:cation:H+ antiporter